MWMLAHVAVESKTDERSTACGILCREEHASNFDHRLNPAQPKAIAWSALSDRASHAQHNEASSPPFPPPFSELCIA